MKRFYKDVTVAQVGGSGGRSGWIVSLDGRPLKTQGGRPQIVPTAALADLLAAEWRDQGEELDPGGFAFRDMSDYAIDVVDTDPDALVDKLAGYGETDTLCYRADPEEPLFRRQHEVWEPLLAAVEQREGIALHRISGVVHRAQPAQAIAKLRRRIVALDPFRLAALEQIVSLSASFAIGMAALEPDAAGDDLWVAANLEEDWQADLWGRDEDADARRERRRGHFLKALRFLRAIAEG